VDTDLTTRETLYLHQDNAIFRYRAGDKKLTLVADVDLRGGRLMAVTRKGELLGIRGQDYFVIKPGDRTLRLRPIPAEGLGRPVLFLEADDKGRIWGGPHFGQTLFSFDPRTKKAVNTGVVSDAGGEVFDVAFLNGKVYAASYAGGDIICYDPGAKWDQYNHVNPRLLATVGPDFIRPNGGIVVGPDQKLYSGWMARYGTYGGAVAVTDPKTGKTERILNPLGAQAITGLAVDARSAYIGTSLSANGLPEKTGESPRFGVLDLASRKVVFSHAFDGTSTVRSVVFDAQTRRVAMVVNGTLKLFDTVSSALVTDLPADLAKVTSDNIVTTGHGRVLFGNEKRVVAMDLANGHTETLAELPARVKNMAVAKDGFLYLTSGADLYRIPNPHHQAAP
jgi:outer membrane protein assembly factor BamB